MIDESAPEPYLPGVVDPVRAELYLAKLDILLAQAEFARSERNHWGEHYPMLVVLPQILTYNKAAEAMGAPDLAFNLADPLPLPRAQCVCSVIWARREPALPG